MEAKDLMIGDWIQVPPSGRRKMKITQLCEDWGDIDDIEPVPLTCDFLKKNGFKLSPNKHYYEYRGYPSNNFEVVDKCTIFLNQEHKPFMLQVIRLKELIDEEKINIHIQYVHQIQQAFRLLGIEKEFVVD